MAVPFGSQNIDHPPVLAGKSLSTSIADAAGVIIYFSIATAVLLLPAVG